jgi:hypothetical protein
VRRCGGSGGLGQASAGSEKQQAGGDASEHPEYPEKTGGSAGESSLTLTACQSSVIPTPASVPPLAVF